MNSKVLKTLEYDKIIERLCNHASSAAGRQTCAQLKPMNDAEAIIKAQKQTTDAVERLRKKASPHFSGLKNILPSIRRLDVGSVLTAQDLLEISQTLDVTHSVKQFLRPENPEEPEDSLTEYYSSLDECAFVNDRIKACILSYEEIADDASPKLKDIRRQMNAVNLRINKTLQSMVNSTSMRTYLQDTVVTIRNGRYCIPVKSEHRNHVPGMVHDQSGSGSTVFIEPMSVVKLNNELKELDLAEAAEILVILSNLSMDCSAVSANLELDYKLLCELDFIFAKASYSEEIGGNAPEFNDDRIIHLKQARHPLLDRKTAVPISVSLGGDFNMLIITGPNTGGKTVSLKTVGLLCLMGQAGLHIPAYDGSSLCLFREIYADTGDEQSIEQSLSTFSSHMTNVVKILKEADSDCLVLTDELCSGTDPTEGAALAQSILTYLHERDICCMATTHYSELKVFALQTPGVQNACCEFDVDTLRPTFKLLIGLPGKSNAFAISSKLGLSEEIIDNARLRIDEGNAAFEDLLADIEINKKTAEQERAEADALMAEVKKLKADLEKEKDSLDKRKRDILRDANQEAYDILQAAKDDADITIKDIRSSTKGQVNLSKLERMRTDAGKKAKASLEKLATKPEVRSAKRTLSAEDIVPGMPVKVLSMNMDGITSGPAGSKGKVPVTVGSMNMNVSVSDLELLTEEEAITAGLKNKKPEKTGIGNLKYSKALGVSGELKLLGLNVDEALLELDKYIDDACMAHLPSARIVHGKGTGALRSAVQSHLKKEKRVKKFYQAEWGDGDAGVTIVEFRK